MIFEILGRLKEVLENPKVVKVMHAAVADCQALKNQDINLWNLYDTAYAHKVA